MQIPHTPEGHQHSTAAGARSKIQIDQKLSDALARSDIRRVETPISSNSQQLMANACRETQDVLKTDGLTQSIQESENLFSGLG